MWLITRNGDLVNLDNVQWLRMVLVDGMTEIRAVFGPGEDDWVEVDTVDSKPWEVSLLDFLRARKISP